MSKIKLNRFNEEKSVDQAFREFVQYCKAKSLARSTVNYYEENYERFRDFLEGQRIN